MSYEVHGLEIEKITLQAPQPNLQKALPDGASVSRSAQRRNVGPWPLITLALAGLGLAAGAYFYGEQARTSAFSDVDEVVLRVETEPGDAKVEFGDDEVQVGMLRTEPSKAERALCVSAPGYVPYETSLALDRNTHVVIVLAELDKPTAQADGEEEKDERTAER